MKIEQLKLENFKCFKTEKIFDFGRLTLLTGANSSGKSTVMQAILSALQSEGFPLSYSPNGQYVNLGDFKEITYNKNKNFINIQLKIQNSIWKTSWSEDKVNYLPLLQQYEYSDAAIAYKIEKKDKELYELSIIKVTECDRAEMMHEMWNEIDFFKKHNVNIEIVNNVCRLSAKLEDLTYILSDKVELPTIFTSLGHNILAFYLGIEKEFSFFRLFNEKSNYIGAFRQPPARTYLEKNKGDFKIGLDGEGYIDQIVEWEKRGNGKIKQLVESLKQLDLMKEVKIKRTNGGRFEMLVKPINGSIFTSLSNVGFGVSQFLPILVADLQLPNDSTLFLAEPEIHLHPSVQSKFGEYIVNQINTSDKNYVIETHSEYLLNRIRLAIVKGELKSSDLKVYFLENTKKDTDVYDIQFTKTGAIQNAPPTFFQTYSVDAMAIALNAFGE
jgi:predicted ATPase